MQIEHAYFLDDRQLLLLLSLIDDNPVVGFSLEEEAEISLAVWQQTVFSLVKNGYLYYETEASVSPELVPLLKTMKTASWVALVHSKSAMFPVKLLYPGDKMVIVEQSGLRTCRLRKHQHLSEIWLNDELNLPRCVLSEEETIDLEQTDEDILRCLEKWKQQVIPLNASASEWDSIPEMRVILEFCDENAKVFCRWVWLEDSLCWFVIQQTEQTCSVNIETKEQRQRLLKILRMEEKNAVS